MVQEHLKEFEPFWQEWYIEEEVEAGNFSDILKIKKQNPDGSSIYRAMKVIEIPKIQVTTSSGNLGERRQALHGYFGELAKVVEEEIKALNVLNGKPNILSYDMYELLERKELVGYDVLLLTPMHRSFISYISGKKLKDNSEIIQMAKDICRALSEVHKMDFLHKDLKLENIYTDEEGKYYLGDIGLENRISVYQTGSVKRGSYEYLAPEVYLNKEYSKEADIYSFGVILYILCNDGKVPKELQRRDKNIELPVPCNAKEKLSEIILKSLSYEIKERYGSADSMLEDLETLTEEDLAFPFIERIEETENIPPSEIEDIEETANMSTTVGTESAEQIENPTFTETESAEQIESPAFTEAHSAEQIKNITFTESDSVGEKENKFFAETGKTEEIENVSFVKPEKVSEQTVTRNNFDDNKIIQETLTEMPKNQSDINEAINLDPISNHQQEIMPESNVNFDDTEENVFGNNDDVSDEEMLGSGLDVTERIIFGNHCFGVTDDAMLIDIPAEFIVDTEKKQKEDITNNAATEYTSKADSIVTDGMTKQYESAIEGAYWEEDAANDITKENEKQIFSGEMPQLSAETVSFKTITETEKTTNSKIDNDFAALDNVEENVFGETAAFKQNEYENEMVREHAGNIENLISGYKEMGQTEEGNIIAGREKNNFAYSYNNMHSDAILQNVEKQYYDQFATKTINSTINQAMQAAQEERVQNQQMRIIQDENSYSEQGYGEYEQQVILKPATPKLDEGEVILKPASADYGKGQMSSFVVPMDSKKEIKEHTSVKKQGDFWKNTPAVGTYVDDMQEPIEIPLQSIPKKKKKTGIRLAILFVLILAAVVVKLLYSKNLISGKEKTADLTRENIVVSTDMAMEQNNDDKI